MSIFTIRQNKNLLFLIGALFIIALYTALHQLPLRAEEPRRAIVALEMLLSGNYWTPTINGEFYYNKPPIYNWLLSLLFAGFGTADWVVRFLSPTSLLITAIINYFFVRKYLSEQTAILSSLCYLLSGDIVFYLSMLGEIDLFYTLLVYLQIIAIFHYYQQQRFAQLFFLSYLFMTIGLLTKGLPSIAFQGITLLTMAFYQRQYRWLFSLQHLAGIILFALLFGGYFYIYSHYNNPITYLLKLFTESSQHTAIQKSWWQSLEHLFLFPLNFTKIFLPWSFLALFLFKQNVRNELKQYPLLQFAAYFVLSNIIIYWLSPGTRDRYLYMFLPFVAMIVTHFYDEKHPLHHYFRHILSGLLLLVSGALILSQFDAQKWQLQYAVCSPLWFFLPIAGIFYLHLLRRYNTFLLLCLLVVVLRCGYNLVTLPIQAATIDQRIYWESTDKILQITQQQPIYLYGKLHTESAYFKKGEQALIQVDYQQPPFIPFQTSFYLSRHNRHPVQRTNEPQKKRFYIAPQNELPADSIKVLYSFHEKRSNNMYHLFQFQ